MRKRILAMGLMLAVLATAVVWFVQRPPVALADDNRGDHLCLASGTGQCLDLKDDNFTADELIIWYNDQQGKGLGWNLSKQGTVSGSTDFPFSAQANNTRYDGDSFYYIQKTTATGHNGCIGLLSGTGSGGVLAWRPCGETYTLWVWSRYGFLVNIDATNQDPTQTPNLIGADLNPDTSCAYGNGKLAVLNWLGDTCVAQFKSV